MKINKIRTIAAIYPWESLEAEVVTNDEHVVYVNFQYDDDVENLDDGVWCYTKPIDVANVDDDIYDYDDSNFDLYEVIVKMKELFMTLMNRKWDNTNEWHCENVK